MAKIDIFYKGSLTILHPISYSNISYYFFIVCSIFSTTLSSLIVWTPTSAVSGF